MLMEKTVNETDDGSPIISALVDSINCRLEERTPHWGRLQMLERARNSVLSWGDLWLPTCCFGN